MRKRNFILRCFVILFFGLMPHLQAAADSKSIEIAVEDEASPWSNKDGTGFANDIVKAAFQAVGIDAQLKVQPYARCKIAVVRGKMAACFSMSWDEAFKETVIFSDQPILVCNEDYFYNFRTNPNVVKNLSELPAGTRIGTVNGYEYPKATLDLKTKGVLLIDAASEEMNLKKLALGRLDYVILNHNKVKPADVMIESLGVHEQVRFAFRGGILKSYIGFSKLHPQGLWALENFNKGYRIILQNGVQREIEKRWILKATKKSAVPKKQGSKNSRSQ